jgi:hypothetical protein
VGFVHHDVAYPLGVLLEPFMLAYISGDDDTFLPKKKGTEEQRQDESRMLFHGKRAISQCNAMQTIERANCKRLPMSMGVRAAPWDASSMSVVDGLAVAHRKYQDYEMESCFTAHVLLV